jgi:hypothetical protein
MTKNVFGGYTRRSVDVKSGLAPRSAFAPPPATGGPGISCPRRPHPIFGGVGRQFAIAFALLAALGVLAAAMVWSTSARGDEPAKPDDVQRVERAVIYCCR